MFNAKELDEETGMYYYSARYYAPPVFTSRDPLFEKIPFMSPYAMDFNNPVKYIDLDGRWPKPILKKNNGNTYSFKPAATHLLSLVSGVKESYIENTIVKERAAGNYRPFYSANKGGGAITLGTSVYNSNITFTENWFNDDHSSYNGHGYGQNIMAWLNLSSHEVGHIPQIGKEGGLGSYLTEFAKQYISNFGHDGAPYEIEADKGSIIMNKFNSFVNETFGENSINNLFNSNRTESQKIEIIDKWWNAYQERNKTSGISNLLEGE
jgi:RHS repeat-associated protein